MKNTPNPRGSSVLPSRSLAPTLIPIAVLVCMLALFAWNAWPVLRPARTIQITQAIFVESNTQPQPESAADQPKNQPQSTRTVQAAGWLEAEPFYTSATALADGIIDKVLVLEGDHVKQGQPLATLIDDDAKLELARANAQLSIARASLAQASAHLRAAQQNWDSPFELQRAIDNAQATLNERNAELAQLPSLIRAQQALLVIAQEELKSTENAYNNKAASEIEFITAREHTNAQSAQLSALQARKPILESAVARIQSDLRAATQAFELRIEDRARVDTALASHELAQATVDQHQVQYDQAALKLNRMTITAPISGYIQRRHKSPGDKIIRAMDAPHSAHIAHIYDPSKLQVRVDVPLADASQVFAGQSCELVVEVLPDRIFKGEVLRVTHEADLQKNTLQVKVRVINPDPILRPEMLTRVKFLPDLSNKTNQSINPSTTSELTATVKIPKSAIESVGKTNRIWIVTQRTNSRGTLQPVNINPIESNPPKSNQDWVIIQSSIQPGTLIAADPARCKPGELVRLQTNTGDQS
ncbi:MAG: efflux RND transporter periplasmic adaptor subunit [Phycisphaerales bacterium]